MKRLIKIGGMTCGACVKNMVSATLSNDLQLQFNWEGRQGWNGARNAQPKRGFRRTTLCGLITSKFSYGNYKVFLFINIIFLALLRNLSALLNTIAYII